MAKKPRSKSEPLEEFYIIVARDVACGEVFDMKDTCGWYDNGDTALAEAAVSANDGEGNGDPQVVYRVTKYVEIKSTVSGDQRG